MLMASRKRDSRKCINCGSETNEGEFREFFSDLGEAVKEGFRIHNPRTTDEHGLVLVEAWFCRQCSKQIFDTEVGD